MRVDPAPPPRDLHLVIPADPAEVRQALRAMFDVLLSRGVTEADRGTAEIVLAEVLNNIVEHAYGPGGGEIEVTVQCAPQELICHVVDSGQPLPEGRLPEGRLAHFDETGQPAEGGYGWFLIRNLSRDLRYRRDGGQNRLCFRLARHDPAG